ncbi:Nitroimidazol reductase NimA, pyridoxamine 5'-phosphate oxidase superfamily [Nonomuraea solani]|uniref:Nitroimidazol reductase NimA, pyridoxamine 5'-phosphate oxidase superfamily n=1 Tax=Nonomuraea solani TaxID=1144553 RepID=A0A1H6EJY2_9ACTN|nr:pyridoxamine 5'-phosphate oxidase family protein [Nonomuraea solani]SEG97165.1 Nitroimidazol reductase NimA, pyridoxamine 5'-phosphate oxidase superfamily [Nonomuraea solani]
MTRPAPRTPEQRRQDTLERLEHDVDVWVATAGEGGEPYMVPLSFLWDGSVLLIATASASVTARNLLANGRARIGVGLVRDVVLIDGTAQATPAGDIPAEVGDAFAAKTGFDPREESGSYHYFRVTPRRLQAWREVEELAGRDLIRDGEWTVT